MNTSKQSSTSKSSSQTQHSLDYQDTPVDPATVKLNSDELSTLAAAGMVGQGNRQSNAMQGDMSMSGSSRRGFGSDVDDRGVSGIHAPVAAAENTLLPAAGSSGMASRVGSGMAMASGMAMGSSFPSSGVSYSTAAVSPANTAPQALPVDPTHVHDLGDASQSLAYREACLICRQRAGGMASSSYMESSNISSSPTYSNIASQQFENRQAFASASPTFAQSSNIPLSSPSYSSSSFSSSSFSSSTMAPAAAGAAASSGSLRGDRGPTDMTQGRGLEPRAGSYGLPQGMSDININPPFQGGVESHQAKSSSNTVPLPGSAPLLSTNAGDANPFRQHEVPAAVTAPLVNEQSQSAGFMSGLTGGLSGRNPLQHSQANAGTR